MENLYEKAATMIKRAKNFYAFTGAGISTESGIPDFRSPGTGLWEKVDPIKTATVDVLLKDPKYFYETNFDRFSRLENYDPNDAHFALASLEKLGFLKGVITQNIDGLHGKAGSKKVWEVHGHVRTCSCLKCQAVFSFNLARQKVNNGELPPLCEKCNGVLRPDVVLFGDSMSADFFTAEQALRGLCDILLVVGSSLTVYPAAMLLRFANELIIINLQPTDYDSEAAVIIREKCGEALNKIMRFFS
jgi:NAD-dependent deacetylase